MMENLKERITMQVKNLDQEQTDFLFDEKANCISALVMHLVATEAYYQVETLEGRRWSKEEEKHGNTNGEDNQNLQNILGDLVVITEQSQYRSPHNHQLKPGEDGQGQRLALRKVVTDVTCLIGLPTGHQKSSHIEDGQNRGEGPATDLVGATGTNSVPGFARHTQALPS